MIQRAPEINREDGKYFSSYFDLNVHELMLKDTARTHAYEEAIKQNKSDFEGKVVLDGMHSGRNKERVGREGGRKDERGTTF
jgi:hypothetical protein